MIDRTSKLLIIGDDGPDELTWEHEYLGKFFNDFVRVSLIENGSTLGSSTELPEGKEFVATLCGARHLAVNLQPYDAALWSLTEHGPFDAVLVGPDRSLKLEDARSSGAYAMASVTAGVCSTILMSVERCGSLTGRSASLAARLLFRLFEEMQRPSKRLRAIGSTMVLWVKLYGSMTHADRYRYLTRVGWGSSRTPMVRRETGKNTGVIEFRVLKT